MHLLRTGPSLKEAFMEIPIPYHSGPSQSAFISWHTFLILKFRGSPCGQ